MRWRLRRGETESGGPGASMVPHHPQRHPAHTRGGCTRGALREVPSSAFGTSLPPRRTAGPLPPDGHHQSREAHQRRGGDGIVKNILFQNGMCRTITKYPR